MLIDIVMDFFINIVKFVDTTMWDLFSLGKINLSSDNYI